MARASSVAVFIILAVIALAIEPVAPREQKRDPVTGKIRILYFGDAFAGPSPYPVYANDPLTSIIPIMASTFHYSPAVIKRHMRIYMPRTEERLVDGFDVIVVSDAGIQAFRTDYFTWFRDAVIEKGFGLVMIGGLLSFGAVPNFPGSWGETVVSEVLPVELLPEGWEEDDGYLEINQPDNPFMKVLPFGEMGRYGLFYGANIVAERQGVSSLAYYRVVSTSERHPFFVYWEVGEGASYAMTADWTPAGGTNFLKWAHYADYALNVAMYVSGGKIPEDISVVYEARRLMGDYRNLRETLNSVIEFVSRFGANMAPAEKILGEAQEIRSMGDQGYLDGEMDVAVARLQEALGVLTRASEKAYDLRDQALLWVYLTEWLVVAGTGMICGFVLWTVMIRRKLYREVGETRFLTN
jgi:uncharacterized membrane protein